MDYSDPPGKILVVDDVAEGRRRRGRYQFQCCAEACVAISAEGGAAATTTRIFVA